MSIPCAAEWYNLHSGPLVSSYLLSSTAYVNLLPMLSLENVIGKMALVQTG